jgi:glycerol-3-phosphate acyltransferase PlsY
MLFIALVIGTYLLGSIPSGLLISRKVARLDITKAGSGNIGATNVAREVGLKWGIIALAVDTLKGFIPVALAHSLLWSSGETLEALKGIVGLSALLGHQFSVYNRFRGGKGVATCLGVFLAISPFPCLLSGIVFLTLVSIWRYVSLGSLVAALAMPIWLYLLGYSTPLTVISLIISALIIFLHRGNVKRLIQGNERRWQRREVTVIDQPGGIAPHRSKTRL